MAKVTTTDKLTKSPVSLTVENGQMSIHLERLMRNHQQQTAFASSRILQLNPYHPLIIKLSEAMGDEALRPQSGRSVAYSVRSGKNSRRRGYYRSVILFGSGQRIYIESTVN